MEKLKVRVNSLLDSNSAQELLVSAGYRRKYNKFTLHNGWVCFNSDNNILCVCSSQAGKELDDYKEITLQELRDMVELKMKEYLVKTDSGNYLYAKNVRDIAAERVIEIPQGANYAATNGRGIFFSDKNDFIPDLVVWVRESPNDKIASAEIARREEKHSHYKKDVSHLNVVDPYRIADLYKLHPCAEHIMKKSLCAGNRGHKDTLRDIQDIIDTAERWKQMIEEDNNEI